MKISKSLCSLAAALSLLLCACGNGGDTGAASSGTQPSSQGTVQQAQPAVKDHGEMRDITVGELVAEMKTGWNLGNTLDAEGGETAWGNPVTTHELIDFVAAAGFNVIRLPVTWYDKADRENGFTISGEWMSRVHEVVDYAFDNDMFVILNCHHETSWIKPSMDSLDVFIDDYKSLWTQISEEFSEYGDHLLFEGLNEPRIVGGKNEWNGGTADGRQALNVLNRTFVETVRATGGNNAKRALLIPSFAASVTTSALKDLEIPDDSRMIVSLHAYTPYSYTFHSKESWELYEYSDEKVGREIDNVFDTIDKYFTDKGIPVIITEYGSVSKSKPGEMQRNDKENEKWITHYLTRAKTSGIPCVLWDNGCYYSGNELFGVLDRLNMEWYVPGLIEAIMSVYE